MEVVTTSDGGSDSQELPPGLWQSVADDQPHAETVTVTLTQSPGEGDTIRLSDIYRASRLKDPPC